ncbi:ATP-binding protein [uncultured Porphyromonas sp.]|uniref:ATP-binding protein n=1 Tax=uncultured Porphyromonas sp. TaxID=159274 RepID=UPI00260890E3|nr:ATP-binding protein [uncultured Porphyromonas sp.]
MDHDDYLLKKSIFRIGEVSSVDGREVSIRVDQEKNRSHILYRGELLSNVSVGGYVKLIKGFNSLIGKIEKEYIKEDKSTSQSPEYTQPEERFIRFLSVKMLGYFSGDKYHKGIKELPLVGNECILLDAEEYQKIHSFAQEGECTIRLGALMTDERVSIDVSVDRLFASHIGIFGNTGSGKSHTLATLYKNLFQKFGDQKAFQENARFILFDFNGEYSNATNVTPRKKVYDLSTRGDGRDKIQLSSQDIFTPEIFFILASATEKTQQPFIRRALKLYGKAQKAQSPLEYTKGILRNKLKQILKVSNGALADLTLGYLESILDYQDDLRSNLGWQSEQKCFYIRRTQVNSSFYFNNSDWEAGIPEIKHWQAIDSLKEDEDFISWITKFLYIQLIDDVLSNRAQNEHVAPAINKLKSLSKEFSKVFSIPTDKETPSLWEEGKPLAVINMSKVSVSMKKLIPLLLSYKYYQEHKNKKSDVVTSSLNIIIDEAHNILSYDSTRESQDWKDFRLETFEEIIKEGRKFGVFLTIASQRPSDISATIISQLHNYLIHRLINNRDLEMVEKAIAYLDKISIESLPILPAGACVLSGIIADLPLILQVDRLSEEEQPESQTIALTESWLDKSTEEGEQTTEEEGDPTMEDKDHTMAEEDLTTADASSGGLDDLPF